MVEILPDCLPSVNCFIAMSTQWRTGAAGPTGLDYTVLPVVFRLQQIPRTKHPAVFDDLRVMEGEALSAIREARN